jgi:hypothetical protein
MYFCDMTTSRLRPASVNSNPLSGHQKAPKGTRQFIANAMD